MIARRISTSSASLPAPKPGDAQNLARQFLVAVAEEWRAPHPLLSRHAIGVARAKRVTGRFLEFEGVCACRGPTRPPRQRADARCHPS